MPVQTSQTTDILNHLSEKFGAAAITPQKTIMKSRKLMKNGPSAPSRYSDPQKWAEESGNLSCMRPSSSEKASTRDRTKRPGNTQ